MNIVSDSDSSSSDSSSSSSLVSRLKPRPVVKPIPYSYTQSYKTEYYKKNKQRIAEANGKQSACKVCGKLISHQRMPRHLKTVACMKAKLEQEKGDIDQMKDRIAKLEEALAKQNVIVKQDAVAKQDAVDDEDSDSSSSSSGKYELNII